MAIVRDLAFFDNMVFHLGLTMVAISNMDSPILMRGQICFEARRDAVLRILSDMMHEVAHDPTFLMPDMRSGLLIPAPYWFARYGEEHQGVTDSFDSSVGTWTTDADSWTLDLEGEECITDDQECIMVQGAHNQMLVEMAGSILAPIDVDLDDEDDVITEPEAKRTLYYDLRN